MDIDEPGKVTAASLFSDILISIFKYLDIKSKGKVAQVCTAWKGAAYCTAIWKDARLTLRSENLSIELERVIIRRHIKRIDVYSLTPKVIEFLRRIPNLEHLRYFGCCIKRNSREFFDTIPNSAALFKLASENDPNPAIIKDFLPAIFCAFDDYHAINFSSCGPNNAHVLKTLTTGMKQLKELHLVGCVLFPLTSFIPNAEIDLFAGIDDRLPLLQKLCISSFWNVNERVVDYISRKCNNLVSLNFEHCEISPDKGFVHLTKLEKLEYLSFVNSKGITGAALKNISRLSKLKFLDLGSRSQITDSGLQSISQLTNLVCLNLRDLRSITNSAFRHLNKLPHLRELGLNSSEVFDEGLFYLSAGNLKLTKLDISFCMDVTDEGILNICRSTFSLHNLNIDGCFKVTDYGVSLIIERFSDLKIVSCLGLSEETKRLVAEKFHRNENSNLRNIANDRDFTTLNIDRLHSLLEPILQQVFL